MFVSFFSKINNLKKLNTLSSGIYLNNFLVKNNFIIFCDVNKAKNFKFLNLKNEIKKLNCESITANQKLIRLENKDFNFLGTHILMILAPNFEVFLKLINLLNNEGIWFFLLYNSNLSSITNIKKIYIYKNNLNILFNLNYFIYKLIIKIFFILSIFIRSIFITYTLK